MKGTTEPLIQDRPEPEEEEKEEEAGSSNNPAKKKKKKKNNKQKKKNNKQKKKMKGRLEPLIQDPPEHEEEEEEEEAGSSNSPAKKKKKMKGTLEPPEREEEEEEEEAGSSNNPAKKKKKENKCSKLDLRPSLSESILHWTSKRGLREKQITRRYLLDMSEKLLEKLYNMGVIRTRQSFKGAKHIKVSKFCKRRLSNIVMGLKLAENLKQAVRFIQHGRIRIGPNTVTDPAFHVTRMMESFVEWVN